MAEASSPGLGKVDLEPRSRLSPFPQAAAAFTGGAISEGEEEEEEVGRKEAFVSDRLWEGGGLRGEKKCVYA